jgi:hypothetical protein
MTSYDGICMVTPHPHFFDMFQPFSSLTDIGACDICSHSHHKPWRHLCPCVRTADEEDTRKLLKTMALALWNIYMPSFSFSKPGSDIQNLQIKSCGMQRSSEQKVDQIPLAKPGAHGSSCNDPRLSRPDSGVVLAWLATIPSLGRLVIFHATEMLLKLGYFRWSYLRG